MPHTARLTNLTGQSMCIVRPTVTTHLYSSSSERIGFMQRFTLKNTSSLSNSSTLSCNSDSISVTSKITLPHETSIVQISPKAL